MNFRIVGLFAVVGMVTVSQAAADSFFTRFSEMEIVEHAVDSQELVANGREGNWHPGWRVPGTRNWRLWLETRIYWRPDADVVVLSRLEISNACFGRYQFVLVPREGFPEASEPSESCSNGILAMRVSHQQIELDIAVRRPDLAHATIRFDGGSMQEIEVSRDDSSAAIAGDGPDVTRWAGVHPSTILDEASERRRFGTIMQREDLYELVYNTYLGVPGHTRLVDGILIAEGCKPHDCGDTRGAIAIEVETGRPYAMVFGRERGLRVFGGALLDMPEALRKIARDWAR